MKIGAFLPITNAVKRGDTFIEAIISHLYWADELVVIDGGSNDGSVEAIEKLNDKRIKILHFPWPQENWSWTQFAKTWNFGLDNVDADWVAAGESDHVFHEGEADRVREEIAREQSKGKAIIKCQKLQSADFEHWLSKSQMYYFVHKSKYDGRIKYGFDPKRKTDLAHPIWHLGDMIEDIPSGEAIIEGSQFENLIGGTGAAIWNYLWTFKTFDMVVSERIKSTKAWNSFSGFSDIYKDKWPDTSDGVKKMVLDQILAVRSKANRVFDLDLHPKIMQEKIKNEMRDEFIGSPNWKL